ncbi:hypothetical protein CAEBREN_25884 [Caenorhabditis brenneri]|uniref:Uncharacterized protein n=1 Tax=Caenorhabditis brenneri TaxID=135651 RepID=G0MCI6_CAEBE|nr:hypothetical protein CAEBREN_25884 [Caenorhabditis brenneri]
MPYVVLRNLIIQSGFNYNIVTTWISRFETEVVQLSYTLLFCDKSHLYHSKNDAQLFAQKRLRLREIFPEGTRRNLKKKKKLDENQQCIKFSKPDDEFFVTNRDEPLIAGLKISKTPKCTKYKMCIEEMKLCTICLGSAKTHVPAECTFLRRKFQGEACKLKCCGKRFLIHPPHNLPQLIRKDPGRRKSEKLKKLDNKFLKQASSTPSAETFNENVRKKKSDEPKIDITEALLALRDTTEEKWCVKNDKKPDNSCSNAASTLTMQQKEPSSSNGEKLPRVKTTNEALSLQDLAVSEPVKDTARDHATISFTKDEMNGVLLHLYTECGLDLKGNNEGWEDTVLYKMLFTKCYLYINAMKLIRVPSAVSRLKARPVSRPENYGVHTNESNALLEERSYRKKRL